MSGYAVIIEQGETGYGAYAPELPGVGVALHVESLRAHGEPVPPPSAVAATRGARTDASSGEGRLVAQHSPCT